MTVRNFLQVLKPETNICFYHEKYHAHGKDLYTAIDFLASATINEEYILAATVITVKNIKRLNDMGGYTSAIEITI